MSPMRDLFSLSHQFTLGLVYASALVVGAAYASPQPEPEASDLKITRALSQSEQTGALAAILEGPRQADYIVAVVNTEPVTNNEVKARVWSIKDNMLSQGLEDLPDDALLAREVLERLIVEKAQIQMAKETGIKVEDFAIEQTLANIAEQNGITEEELLREVALRGQTQQSFREDIRNQLLMQRLQSREVEARVQVSEQDIDQYLAKQKNPANDLAQTSLNLGHILISVPEGASLAEVEQRQEIAKKAAQAARTDPDFEAVAKQFSDGGDPIFGMRPADRYPSLFVQAVGTTPKDGVVGPVRSPAGFHILKVIDRSASPISVEVTQTHARHILLRTSAQLSEGEAVQRLRELRQRVVEGTASFEDLARQYSEDGSAAMGGDLGWAGPGTYVPEFEQVLNALEIGQVSSPVVSRFGVHLILLEGRRQAALTDREQREALREVIRAEKLEKANETWLQELRGQAYVEYRDPPK